ncbi:MAG: hypothetical protein ACOCQE_01900 [Halanaerobium sp.]
MEIIYLLELDKNAEVLRKKDMLNLSQSQIELSSDNYPKKEDVEFNIAGQWLLIDELLEVDNNYLTHLKNKDKNMTWIKLPDKYVEENYLVDYESDDECPLGIDVLIKEDNYPISVVSGCDSIKQAKVDNNLDGHKYKGELGIKLNKDYFLTFKEEDEEFKIVNTNVDWDRGERTV